jgi:hypothetical protein
MGNQEDLYITAKKTLKHEDKHPNFSFFSWVIKYKY